MLALAYERFHAREICNNLSMYDFRVLSRHLNTTTRPPTHTHNQSINQSIPISVTSYNSIIKFYTMLTQIKMRKSQMIRQKIQRPLMPATMVRINHPFRRHRHRKKAPPTMQMMMKVMTTMMLRMPAKMVQMNQRNRNRNAMTQVIRMPPTRKLMIGSFIFPT